MILNDGFNTLLGFPAALVTGPASPAGVQNLPQMGGFGGPAVGGVPVINAGVGLWSELEVTPPKIDGRGEIDNTGMRNIAWTTAVPKYLKTLGKLIGKVKWDPLVYAVGAFFFQINQNQLVAIFFPSFTNAPARTLSYMGWLSAFTPEVMKEGELPKGDMEVTASNQASTAVNGRLVPNGTEVAPVLA